MGKVVKVSFRDPMNLLYVGPLTWEILDVNGGFFPSDTDDSIVRSFCCWYICSCAHRALDQIPAQVTMEGEKDVDVSLRKIAEGCMLAYGIDKDDSEEFGKVMALMPLARRQAFKMQRNWSSRFQAWLVSGGRAYDAVTREPDAI